MRIEIFIDDESVPRQTLVPPATLELDTEGLADGPHRLRVHAIENSGTVGVEVIPFTVRNGPGIAVVGLSDGDTVRGRVPLLVNAFASRPGTLRARRAGRRRPSRRGPGCSSSSLWHGVCGGPPSSGSSVAGGATITSSQASTLPHPAGGGQPRGRRSGRRVYGSKCSACHQLTGEGLPGPAAQAVPS
jgi:hypothetical protein